MNHSPDTGVPHEVTLREINELVRTFAGSGWASLDLEFGDIHLTLGREGAPTTRDLAAATTLSHPAPAPTVLASAAAPVHEEHVVAPLPGPEDEGALEIYEHTVHDTEFAPAPVAISGNRVEVRSPAVGSFWRAPSPGEAPFVDVGEMVVADQQLGIVEIMKLMNHVSAPCAGKLVEICADNAAMVEFDQLLFVIEAPDG